MIQRLMTARFCVFTALLVILPIFTQIPLQAEEQQKVVVTFKIGSVWLYRSEQSRQSLKTAMHLQPGDRIVTESNGRVHFRYGMNHEVRVNGNAEVKVGSASLPRENMLMVAYGKIRAKSINEAKQDEKSPFKVVTPTSVCAVRGTDFQVNVTSNGTSSTEVANGWVNMGSGDKEVPVKNRGNAVTKMGAEPSANVRNISQVLKNEDAQLKKDPKAVASGYDEQNQYFKDRSQKNANETKAFSSEVRQLNPATTTPEKLQQVEEKKDKVVNRNENDFYRNEIQGDALQRIIRGYQEGKDKVNQGVFDQVKKNSDAIAELQQKNLENIRKIMEAYDAKRREIMEKLDETRGKVKGDLDKMKDNLKFDFNKVKPQFNQDGN